MAQPLVKKDDDRDDEMDYSPFMGIEKGAVLQEARVFNDPQLDARRCSQVITKLLYLLNQGEAFTKAKVKIKNKNRSFKYSKLNGKMPGRETYFGIYISG